MLVLFDKTLEHDMRLSTNQGVGPIMQFAQGPGLQQSISVPVASHSRGFPVSFPATVEYDTESMTVIGTQQRKRAEV